MEPDNEDFNITVSGDADIEEWLSNIALTPSSSLSVGDISYDTMAGTFTVFNGTSHIDITDNSDYHFYSVTPVDKDRTVYISVEQKVAHEKYPALEKAWNDYIALYSLAKGEPPIVD